jgi:hypothetical protein
LGLARLRRFYWRKFFAGARGACPNGGIQPNALAADGVVHLLYYPGDAAHGDLYYVRSSDDGKAWSQLLRVNSQPGNAVALGTIRGGQMALGRNGRVYVVWNGSSETEAEGPMNPESGKRGRPLLYTRLANSHATFEPERNLMTHTLAWTDVGPLQPIETATSMWLGMERLLGPLRARLIAMSGLLNQATTAEPSRPSVRQQAVEQVLADAAVWQCIRIPKERFMHSIGQHVKMFIATLISSPRPTTV